MTHQPSPESDRLRQAVSNLPAQRRALLLSQLAARSAAKGGADGQLPRRPRGTDRLPCSTGQERLYYLHLMDPASVNYLLPVRLRLRGTPDPAALRTALAGLVSRHEPLRTGFEVDEQHLPIQVVHPATAVTVSCVVATGTTAEVDAEVLRLTGQPFELSAPPLLRAGLWQITDQPSHWMLAICVHHAVVDGWSLGVLVDELAALYDAAIQSSPPDLPELPLQYGDYAIWERDRPVAHDDLDFWRRTMAGAPALELHGDRPRPRRPTFAGASVPVRVAPELVAALDSLGRAAGATPFMVLLAAFTVLLRRWSGQSDLVVGTPVAGRSRPELERLVGLFVNTLLLRITLTDTMSFQDLLQQVRTSCVAAFQHQDVPFEQVIKELDVVRSGGRPDLPRALFAMRNVEIGAPRLSGLEVHNDELPRTGTDIDLSLELAPSEDGGIDGWLVYATDLFNADTAVRLTEGLQATLAAVAADAAQPVDRIPVLFAEEQRRIQSEFSGTGTAAVALDTLHGLFEAQAARTPNAPAVLADVALTYQELDERANQLATALVAGGVQVEDRVGVHLHRGSELVIALLGVLKAGAVYLPLDPEQPAERLAQIVRDAGPPLIVSSPELASVLDRPVVIAGEQSGPVSKPEVPVRAENAGGLLYTSGSTGRPKGAVLTHRGMANRMAWMAAEYAFCSADVVLQKTPIGSDPSLWEMLVPLCSGGRVVFAQPGRHTDVAHLLDLLRRYRVTACDFVPSMLAAALSDPGFAESASALRLVVCGGEELPAHIAERLLELVPDAALLNFYGPTEVSFDATVAPITRPVALPVPIGRPIAGVQAYVLNAAGAVQPVGVPGELFLGGVQIARGYLNMPGRTAETLVPHPFKPGQRLYRTGDRVRWRADGSLEFLGRQDNQVKVRGYRVEPGEIEAVLRSHDAVETAVVRVFDSAVGPRLIGYLSAAPGGAAPSTEQLRRYLAARLPSPMVPAAFVVLDALPLLANGKIDRNALQEPGRPTAASTPPATALEMVLCHIWRHVLDEPNVGVHDDFFELGGHSLLATRVVAQMRETFRIDFPLHVFVETPTVAASAAMLRERAASTGGDVDRIAGIALRVLTMSAEDVDAELGAS